MNPKINRKSNGAFTLVEIIGVMAIIGILGAVVAPRVIDGIREGRVTQLAQNLGQWKSGADRYLQKQQKFPADGSASATTQEGLPYIDPRSGATVAAAQTSLGDWLLAQGLVSAINVPFGTQAEDGRIAFTSVTLASPLAISSVALSTFAQIRCSKETDTLANTFSATQTRDVPHNVVYLAIPSVPLQEAAAIKSKIDGPFRSSTDAPVNDNALLAAAVAQTTTGIVAQAQSEALARGNCRVGAGTTGTYNLYIYITND
jgi:type II secretory pathway pseudopilin PulG